MSTMKEKALFGASQEGMFIDERNISHVPEDSEDIRVVKHVCLAMQGFSFLIARDTLILDELNHYYRIRIWNCGSCGKIYWSGHKVDIDSTQAYQIVLQDIQRYNTKPVDYSGYGTHRGMTPEMERFYMLEGMDNYEYTPEQYVKDMAEIDPRTEQRVVNQDKYNQEQKVANIKSKFNNIESWLG